MSTNSMNVQDVSGPHTAKLQDNWNQLVSAIGGNQALADKWWNILSTKYSEAHRRYHTLQHIEELTNLCKQYNDKLENPNNVLLAIWFHDVIYNPRQGDNEDQSKALFLTFMEECPIADKDKHLVSDYIMATKSHAVTAEEEQRNDTDLKFFLDFDLAILGASPEKYKKYADQIRYEYIHVPKERYEIGRTKVLQSLMAQDLFKTEPFREHYAEKANANMQREIESLHQNAESAPRSTGPV